MRVAERQRARELVVLFVECAAGDENENHCDSLAVPRSPAARYSVLNSRGNVAWVWPRCCGRKPNRMICPWPRSTETAAARPAIKGSPLSHPDARIACRG